MDMKKAFFTLSLIFSISIAFGQYQFTMISDCHCTPVTSQDRTGTCWSFATSSFLEAELIRMGKRDIDLSEMYFVRKNYEDKALNYYLRQGKAQFGQGGLAHDVINAFAAAGAVPQEVYSGLLPGENRYDHSEMEAMLKAIVETALKSKSTSEKWMNAYRAVIDNYMGSVPENFTYKGKTYTPKTFAASLGIDPGDYVSFTSYTHHPFYSSFVLEIPDNWSNGSFINVPIEDLVAIAENAVENGYSVAWDGDVSEKTFSARKGIAVLPANDRGEEVWEKPGEEVSATQELRQQTFESFSTTDDHLMHITGVAKDQNGTHYFYIKNSWGEISPYDGYLYMSEPYFRLKTVSIMVHKDAVPENVKKKLGWNL